MNFVATLANSLWAASSVPAWLRFRRALSEPGATQRALLLGQVRENADTAFGKAHSFSKITSYEGYSRHVPLADYDTFAPWIERIRNGESNVLTRDPVTHLIPTSGSTGARKLIPFTAGLQREFNAAIAPWLVDLNSRVPGALGGPAYWSVTPALRGAETDTSRVPVGFAADTEYLGGGRGRLVDAVMAVPAEVQHAPSLEAFRHATMLSLLRCGELRLISVWHPSFLSLLLDALPVRWEELLSDVDRGSCGCAGDFPEESRRRLLDRPRPKRAKALRTAGPARPDLLWPELRVISCWCDGPAALGAAMLRERFPNVVLQPKGLLATEAFVTLPFDERHPLTVASHFFEFLDTAGRVHLADGLREGEEYEVIVTTAGGLWRYKLADRVAVNGVVGRTPSLRFLGRNGNVSDRFGEKLSEPFVIEVLRELFGDAERPPRFALIAPDEDEAGCRYTIYVEGALPRALAEALDRALRRNPHYAHCREMGQLLSPRTFSIATRGYESFAARETKPGGRLGCVKPAVLSQLSGWSKVFVGKYEGRPILEAESA